MVQMHENIVGIDAAIFMHPTTWKASGHVDAFNDPLIDNKDSKKRYRADVLVEEHIAKIDAKIQKDVNKGIKRFGDDFDEKQFRATNPNVVRRQDQINDINKKLGEVQNNEDLEAFRQLIIDLEIKCAVSGVLEVCLPFLDIHLAEWRPQIVCRRLMYRPTKKSGQRNLQACVTVPPELRPIIGRKQIYKSLGTFDPTVAKERLRAKEAEIFRELDKANLAGHPLALAALELERALWSDLELSDGSNASFPEDLIRKRAALWFDPDKRWDEYDNLVQRAGEKPSGTNPTMPKSKSSMIIAKT
jgi:hypothetical protein